MTGDTPGTTPEAKLDPLVISTGEPWTPEQIAWFRERLKAAMANPGPPVVLPSEHWKDRAEAAEAKLAATTAALRRHVPSFTDPEGVVLCGGCLQPAPCPDAALAGEEP